MKALLFSSCHTTTVAIFDTVLLILIERDGSAFFIFFVANSNVLNNHTYFDHGYKPGIY